MPRYFLETSYLGLAYNGSQLQGVQPTVQLSIQEALAILCKQPVETIAASRTDAGVHAHCNFFHFDVDSPLPATFIYNLNALLPADICVNKIFIATKGDAHARFDAIWRSYRYKIYNKKNPFYQNRACHYPFPLSITALQETAQELLIHTNFASFAKRNSQAKTTICTLYKSYWEMVDDQCHYVVSANRFLRGMVRGLVATQLTLAKKKAGLEGLRKIFEASNSEAAYFNVPGHGLYLEEIKYPEGLLEQVQ